MQCSVGRFNLLSNEKNLSFSVGIYENDKLINVDGIDAVLHYFGDPDDKESLIYKVMKANKISVLKSVKGNGEVKLTFAQLKNLTSVEIAEKIGYPGKTPVFIESAPTKPRVYYILP